MPVTKPIPVRLDDLLIDRIDAAAKRMGTNRSALIKFLTKTFLDHFESCGGVASLPHDWREIMRGLDGRTFGQIQFQSQTLRAAEDSPAYGKNKKATRHENHPHPNHRGPAAAVPRELQKARRR